jgi:hypothetical protein
MSVPVKEPLNKAWVDCWFRHGCDFCQRRDVDRLDCINRCPVRGAGAAFRHLVFPEDSAPRLSEHSSFDDHQVCQRKQGVQLRGVLSQTAVAQLLVAEQIFDDVEGMFDPGAHL